MVGERNTRHSLVKVLALSLAVVFVFSIAQVLFHSHAKGQNEATCQVCQAAHLGSAPTAGTTSLFGPLLAAGYVQPFVLTIHQEFFFHDSPSRAPPTT
jgi:cytochrome c5